VPVLKIENKIFAQTKAENARDISGWRLSIF
jgi:hypothetical protein